VLRQRHALKQSNKKQKKKCQLVPQFGHGDQVPRTIEQAMDFNGINDNALLQESIKLEIKTSDGS
jgi:hypothetical protein